MKGSLRLRAAFRVIRLNGGDDNKMVIWWLFFALCRSVWGYKHRLSRQWPCWRCQWWSRGWGCDPVMSINCKVASPSLMIIQLPLLLKAKVSESVKVPSSSPKPSALRLRGRGQRHRVVLIFSFCCKLELLYYRFRNNKSDKPATGMKMLTMTKLRILFIYSFCLARWC